MSTRFARALAHWLTLTLVIVVAMPVPAHGQGPANREGIVSRSAVRTAAASSSFRPAVKTEPLSSTLSRYVDPAQGVASDGLIRRALATNAELAAARLDIDRARA